MKKITIPAALFITLLIFVPNLYGQQSYQINTINNQSKQVSHVTVSGADQHRQYYSLYDGPIKRSEIKNGDFIEIQTSETSTSTLEVVRIENYTRNTTSFFTKDVLNPENTFTFTYSNGRIHGLFHKSHDDIYFFEYDNSTSKNYLAKNSSYYDNTEACSIHEANFNPTNVIPGHTHHKGKNTSGALTHIPNMASMASTIEDSVTIDIMIPYTENARIWAENSTSNSIDAVIATAMANSQAALDNSDVFVTLRLVHYYETNYTHDSLENLNENDSDFVSAGDHLRRLTRNPENPFSFCGSNDSDCDDTDFDGFMEEVHQLRDEFGADLVAAVMSEPNTGGIAFLNSSNSGSPETGFSVNRVQQIANGYTLVHELGHNMGNAHARNQSQAKANDFGGLFAYSTGNRFFTASNNYSTVMAYSGDSFQGIPYFSNPDISFEGKATGTPITHTGSAGPADNARSMREIKHVIASYRQTLVDPPIIDVDKINISATLNQENSTATIPITIRNDGDSDLMWHLDFDIASQIIASKKSTTPSNKPANLFIVDENVAAGSMFSAAGDDGVILSSNFETDNGFSTGEHTSLVGWRTFSLNIPFEISDQNPSVGGQHLRLSRMVGTSNSVFTRSPFFGPQPMAEYSVSFDMATSKSTNVSGTEPLFDVYIFDASNGTISAGVIITRDNNIFARSLNEGGEENFSFANATFPSDGSYRNIEIKFNPNNRSIDYYIEGTLITSNPYPIGKKPDYIYLGHRNDVSDIKMDIDNLVVKQEHTPFNWLLVEKFGGIVKPSETETFEITLNALDVPSDLYQTVLQVKSNDPDNPVIEVPVSADIEMATSTESSAQVPERVQLRQNFPNPFNPTTNIQFSLNQTSDVTLEVFNITGQKVATLIRGTLNAGSHQHTFDASGLSSGLYIYRLQTPEQSFTRQMILIK